MKSHHWLFAAAFPAALLFFAASRLGSVPITADSAVRFPSATPSPSLAPSERRNVKYDFIAERVVLAEFAQEAIALKEEVAWLGRDAESIWSSWQTRFGIVGGWTTWGLTSEVPNNLEAQQTAFRIQTDLFHLRSRAAQMNRDVEDLRLDVQKAQGRWDELSQQVVTGRGTDAFYNESIVSLRAKLRLLNARFAGFDADLLNRQEDFDSVYPRLDRFLKEAIKSPTGLVQPHHWTYMLNNRQAPRFSPDFVQRYARALEAARRDIDGR